MREEFVQSPQRWHNAHLTREHDSAVKGHEIMPLAAARMDLKILKPSEVSQTRKTNIMLYQSHVELKKRYR